jgi:hypothetical protein
LVQALVAIPFGALYYFSFWLWWMSFGGSPHTLSLMSFVIWLLYVVPYSVDYVFGSGEFAPVARLLGSFAGYCLCYALHLRLMYVSQRPRWHREQAAWAAARAAADAERTSPGWK